jgi:adenosylhomocysteine nucleosidase
MGQNPGACILISAGAEWRALLEHFPDVKTKPTPYGDCFSAALNGQNHWFMHGGWGKVAAAGSTQYAISRWKPRSIVNLGTCGGFSGRIQRGEVILPQKTVIYDIIEQMSDPEAAISAYSVDFDLSWLPDPSPQPVKIGTLLSADRDILAEDIPGLIEKYQADVADWESGAIAWVAQKNNLPCLILRGVSDLVGSHNGEAYGNYAFFEAQCREIMANFTQHLEAWLAAFSKVNSRTR